MVEGVGNARVEVARHLLNDLGAFRLPFLLLEALGLGCPRQEVFAYEYRDLLNMPVLAVGAAFDFHAGLVPQAPLWIQSRGLEWLFRLIQEPKRLWRRYARYNPRFVRQFARQLVRQRRSGQPAAPVVRSGPPPRRRQITPAPQPVTPAGR